LKRNVIANLLGGGWVAGLSVLLTPLQIRLLGMEAYGLLGLLAMLQIAVAALDFGLPATVMQKISSGSANEALLVNSVSTLYLGFAATLAGGMWISADWLARHLLKTGDLALEVTIPSIRLIGVFLATRFHVGLYNATLTGRHLIERVSVIKVGVTTLRYLGGIMILLIAPQVTSLLAWFVVSALVEVGILYFAVNATLPNVQVRPAFSAQEIRGVWHLSFGLNLIAILSVLLTQVDRLVVGSVLSLKELGYYSLAYNLAIGVSLVHTSINSAMLPSVARDFGNRHFADMLIRYTKSSQLIMYLECLPVFVLVFFGYDILRLWINADAAFQAQPAVAVLALAFVINAAVSPASTVAVALAKPRVVVAANVAGLVLYAPLLYFLVKNRGIVGAALSALMLSLFFVVTVVPSVHRKLLFAPVLTPLARNAGSFMLLGASVFGVAHLSALQWLGIDSPYFVGILLMASLIYLLAGYLLLTPLLRVDVKKAMQVARQALKR